MSFLCPRSIFISYHWRRIYLLSQKYRFASVQNLMFKAAMCSIPVFLCDSKWNEQRLCLVLRSLFLVTHSNRDIRFWRRLYLFLEIMDLYLFKSACAECHVWRFCLSLRPKMEQAMGYVSFSVPGHAFRSKCPSLMASLSSSLKSLLYVSISNTQRGHVMCFCPALSVQERSKSSPLLLCSV